MDLKFLILYPLLCADVPAPLTESLHSIFPKAQIGSKVLPDVLDSDFRSDLKRRESTLYLYPCDERSLPLLDSIMGQLRTIRSAPPLLVVHPANSQDIGREAVALGAAGSFSLLQPSADIQRLIFSQFRKPNSDQDSGKFAYPWQDDTGLVGSSPAIREVLEKMPSAARSLRPVLITGETGTGKEVVAHAIHHLSPHKNGPFRAVQCGAIAANLFENEFFGHEAGAFTDAKQAQKGFMAHAEDGTLFLDEIDTLDEEHQVKILRLIEEHEYSPIGFSKVIKGNIRIVVATNADLRTLVKTGAFRVDLYYRINVLNLEIPPLRNRREDIADLARHLIRRTDPKTPTVQPTLSEGAIFRLMDYDWPGNVRELDNVLQRALLSRKGNEIQADELDIPEEGGTCQIRPYKAARAQATVEFETKYFTDLMTRSSWNISQAAKLADMDRSDLSRKMHALGLSRPNSEEPSK